MQPNRKDMKKIVLIIIGVLFVASLAIDAQHQKIEDEWGKWKTETLDGAHPERPSFCVYCDYINPLIQKYYE